MGSTKTFIWSCLVSTALTISLFLFLRLASFGPAGEGTTMSKMGREEAPGRDRR